MSEPVPADGQRASPAHAAGTLALVFGPLLLAVQAAGPAEPLFPGTAALLGPLYYLGVLGVALVPSVRAWRESAAGEREADAVVELQRRYVEDDIGEAELEARLERELEREN